MRHPIHSVNAVGVKRKRRHARRTHQTDESNSSVSVFPSENHNEPYGKEIGASGSRALRVTADILSVLIGATIGIAIQSLITVSSSTFAGEHWSATLVVASGLLTLAIGVRFPQWLTVRICAYAWQRVVARGASSKAAAALLNPRRPDASLNWIVLSATLLVAGLFVVVIPVGYELATEIYLVIRDHFVWSWSTITILQFITTFAVLVVPMSALGLAASFAHRVSDENSTWHSRATGWILVGAGAGVWIAGGGFGSIVHPNLMLMYASLLPLTGSLLAGLSQKSVLISEASPQSNRCLLMPIRSDRFPTLLRTSITVVGATGIGAAALWIGTEASETISPHSISSVSCLAMGIGVIAGCWWGRHRYGSIGRFGATCQITGIVAAVSTMLLASQQDVAGHWRVTTLAITLFAIGVSKASGRHALLTCVASRPFAGSRVLARMLVWSSISIVVFVPISLHLLGSLGALTLIPLIYLVLGGVLLIYEPLPESLAFKRGRQVAAFSVAVMAMIAWYWSR